jgi:hypothetical protein
VSQARIERMLALAGFLPEMREGLEAQALERSREALERWVRGGLACDLTGSDERRFDPREVTNHFLHLGRLGEDPFWREHYVRTKRDLVEEARPGTFHVRLEREYDVAPTSPGGSVRLRLPLPVEDPSLRNLQLTLAPVEGATHSVLPGCVDYRFAPAQTGRVVLAFDATFEALLDGGAEGGLSAAERELFTRPSEGFIVADDAMPALAHSLADASLGGGEATERFFAHLLNTLALGVFRYGDLASGAALSQALSTGWADCQMAASALCALCRARGIPARVVGGYPLHRKGATTHYWAEVWIEGEGWRTCDFVRWHLALAEREPQWPGASTAVPRLKLQVFPRLVTGFGSRRFPQNWHMVSEALPGGVATAYEDAETGRPLFTERFFIAPA